ncbi:MAG TPA: nucleoside triphosphate pyrophosphohydrolase [Gammaproteobacteria bacterium]|nr:nucleoside triphosphate pyrophosphohydrolase [Gammaproteobacteria bacterium]
MKTEPDTTSLAELLRIMARLRDRERGCPWDLEQSFATIAPYTIEEAYEVADAIERNDLPDLKDELGDLLFQVVFHARMAEEAGAFAFADVARAICDKMLRRHPHVFGSLEVGSSAEQTELWERIKREERAGAPPAGILDDVPVGLPALTRATKLGKRAASVGFDWPDVAGVRAKIDEELAEVDAAMTGGDESEIAAELGDLLFSIANLTRHLELDPETCLRAANARFARRFHVVESEVAASGKPWSSFAAPELDRLWNEAKKRAK